MGWLRVVVVGGCLGLSLFSSAFAADWKASGNVDLTLEDLYWTAGNVPPDNNRNRPIGTLRLPMGLRYGRGLKFRLLPNVQSDPNSPSTNERLFWDIQEGYMQLQSLPWTFQLGMNVQNWGDTDVFNPLDVVNARRYYDPLRSEKLGAPTVLIKRDWENFFFEALYIPVQRETKLPGESSRWMPRDVYKSRKFEGQYIEGIGTLSGTIVLPSNLSYHYRPSTELDHSLSNNFGARMKFRFPGFDWTIAAFLGAAPTPSVNIDTIGLKSTLNPGAETVTITVDPDVYLRALYYKNRMVGTSFVWVFGPVLVKGASAHNKPLSTSLGDLLPKAEWDNALGLERTVGIGSGSLTMLAQGTYIKRDEKLDTNSVSLSRMFDRAVMGGLRYAPSERTTILASYLYDIQYKGSFAHGEFSYKLADGWLGKIAGDHLGGPAETPTGTYRKNSRVVVSLNIQK